MKSDNLTEYKGIDLFKLFFAWCVIEIHWNCFVPLGLPQWGEWILLLAVPYFFVSSGFLLSRRQSQMPVPGSYFISRAGAAFRIFLLWIVIYMPLDIVYFHQLNDFSLLRIVKWGYRLLISGEGSYSWPMWYLYSLTIAFLLMALACRFRRGFKWLFVGLCLVNVAAYYGLFNVKALMLLADRGLFGCLFVLAGWLFPVPGGRMRLPAALALLVVSWLCFRYGLPLSRLIGGVGALWLSLSLPAGRLSVSTSLRIRSASMWVFYTHMYFVFAVTLATYRFGHDTLLNIMTVLVVTLVGFGLARLSENPGFGFLKRLVK